MNLQKLYWLLFVCYISRVRPLWSTRPVFLGF